MILTKKLLASYPLWFTLWLLWMGVIFAFSSISGNPTYYEPTLAILMERKGAHIFEYAVLFILSLQIFSFWFSRESLYRITTLAALWSLAYAVTDELHQFFIPYRGANFTDVVIDGVGILAALMVMLIFTYYKKRPLN